MVKVCKDANSNPPSTFMKLGGVEHPNVETVIFLAELDCFYNSSAEIFVFFFPGGDADRWHCPADYRRHLSNRMHLGRRSASVSVVP